MKNRRGVWLRQYLLSGLVALMALGVSCTCEQILYPAEPQIGDCDPHSPSNQRSEDALRLSQLLKQQPEGVQVCLQLGLGQEDIEQVQSQLVLLKQNGSIQSPNAAVLSFQPPTGAEKSKRRLRLFVFSPQFSRNAQAYCRSVMNSPTYGCLDKTEDGICLAQFEFRSTQAGTQPDKDLSFPIGQEPTTTCMLTTRSRESTEPATHEPDEEPPREKGEPEPAPEPPLEEPDASLEQAAELPESAAEFVPESAPEPIPEPIPESIPESIPEPCQPASCPWMQVSGGQGDDAIYAVKLAANGDIIIAGSVQATNPQFGQLTTPPTYGKSDIFVARLDATGKWLWVRVAGSVEDDQCWAMDVDQQGDIYIGGYYSDKATFGSFTLPQPNQTGGSRDAFVAKLSATGQWIWAKQLGGKDDDQLTSLVVGPFGDIYIGGIFKQEITLAQTHRHHSSAPLFGQAQPDRRVGLEPGFQHGHAHCQLLPAQRAWPLSRHPIQRGRLFDLCNPG